MNKQQLKLKYPFLLDEELDDFLVLEETKGCSQNRMLYLILLELRKLNSK